MKQTKSSKSKLTHSKSARPIQTVLLNDSNNGNKKRSNNRKKPKHIRGMSKTTDDIDSFKVLSHDKWSYYSTEITAAQQIRCQVCG